MKIIFKKDVEENKNTFEDVKVNEFFLVRGELWQKVSFDSSNRITNKDGALCAESVEVDDANDYIDRIVSREEAGRIISGVNRKEGEKKKTLRFSDVEANQFFVWRSALFQKESSNRATQIASEDGHPRCVSYDNLCDFKIDRILPMVERIEF